MGLKLRFLQILIPARFKRTALKELFEYSAYAFECVPPSLEGLSLVEALHAFAEFFTHEAEKAVRTGNDLGGIKRRLRENARLLGEKLKERFRVRTLRDAFLTARAFFRALMIDFEGDRDGEIVVRRCFFSSRFSKEVCAIISAFDEGLLSGLSGGGVLTFVERITDCSACCRARFKLTGA